MGRAVRVSLGAVLVATALTVSSATEEASAASLVQVSSFGSNPGNLKMFKYVPDGLGSNRPLVVALHGCTQMASSYDSESGWTKYAELWDFALALPEQQTSNNGSRCFNWFEPGDYSRGFGEALSIKQMVDKMVTDHGTDSSRVFVTGLSAGGAMTTVMLATYPDVFAGGGVMSGLPYKCATGSSEAFSCMSPGKNLTPTQWGNLVRGASSHGGPWPKVSVWHGTSDFTVATMNMTETMEQWTNVHGIDQTADTSDTVAGYPHKVYKNGSGTPLVETYSITNMGHGTPVDPGTATEQCGTAGAYILDVNVCSSYHLARFWGIDGGGAPPTTTTTTSSTTTTTAPPGGGSSDFANSSVNDGYVKAYADGSGAAVGSFSNLPAGRGTDSKFNRLLLSFDTSSLPDSATVTRAWLTVAHSSSYGDPWANPSGNQLVIDVKTGCFGGCTTETGDFLASPTAASVAAIAKFMSGTKDSGDFSSAGRAAINRSGTTQLKLRFSQNQTVTNYVFIKGGSPAVLHVEYS